MQEMKRKPKDSSAGVAAQSVATAAESSKPGIISRQPSLEHSGIAFLHC